MNSFARPTALLPLLMTAVAFGAESGAVLSKVSPFNRPGAAGMQAEAAGENIEFAGISEIGKTTDLLFRDKAAKKNYWLAKGETAAGITVLNYDAVRELAVVKFNGVEKVLKLRESSRPTVPGRAIAPVPTGFNIPALSLVSAPAASPVATAMPAAPVTPVPSGPVTPESQAKQETEARMLVSDLLEIGMAQRRAYEEKQKQAGSGGTEAATQPPANPAPPPAP